MKVSDLKILLEQFPNDMEVRLQCGCRDGHPASSIKYTDVFQHVYKNSEDFVGYEKYIGKAVLIK